MAPKTRCSSFSGQHLLGRLLGRLGDTVSRHPLGFALIPLALALVSTAGLPHMRLTKEFQVLFVPTDSPSHAEIMASERMEKLRMEVGEARAGPEISHLLVFVSRLDGLNVLQPGLLNFIANVSTNFTRDFRYAKPEGGDGDLFELCGACQDSDRDCHDNEWLDSASRVFSERLRNSPNIEWSFPLVKRLEEVVDLSGVVLGAEWEAGPERTATALVLRYSVCWGGGGDAADPASGPESPRAVAARSAFRRYWEGRLGLGGLRFVPVPQEAFEDEAARLTAEVAGWVPLSVALLTGLLLVFSVPRRCPSLRPLLSVLAVLSVLLSLLATLGLLAALGFPFNPVVAVAPYLVLAIGVDDSFLILGAWKSGKRFASGSSGAGHGRQSRLGQALDEVGPALVITTATDSLTFFVGYFLSRTPAMADFSLFTALALVADFVYQVSFFVAMLVYCERWEPRLSEALLRPAKAESQRCPLPAWTEGDLGDRLSKPKSDSGGEDRMAKWLGRTYTRWILQPWVRVVSALLFAGYIAVSLVGCASLTTNIDPKKLTLQGQSSINAYFDMASEHIYRHFVPADVFVFRPPELSEPSELQSFLGFVEEMERLPFALGPATTHLWLRDFLTFAAESTGGFPSQALLSTFLAEESAEKRYGSSLVVDEEGRLRAFRFRLFYGPERRGLETWQEKVALLEAWRALADRHSRFDILVYSAQSLYVDQFSILGPSALQTLGCGILAMWVVGALFSPHPGSVFFVSSSVVSIGAGVMGLVGLGGGEIDHVTLGSFLTSIGLAIDFSLHVSIRFYRSEGGGGGRGSERVGRTLGSVGWPLTQAAASSAAGVAVVGLAPAYVATVFARTVCLVQLLGLLHALLFLPLFQHALHPQPRHPRPARPPSRLRSTSSVS